MKKTRLIITMILCCFFAGVRSQELIKPAKLNVKYTMDKLGDAHIEAGTTMDAAQWDNYKKMLGNNPDILKRQMERTFPSFFLQNFSYKEDIMNRSYTLSFDALGMSRINPKGQWEVDLNTKNPDITKLSDNNYILTSSYASSSSLIQEIDNINFPASASDVKLDKDAFGKAIFLYSLSPGTGASGWFILFIGAALMAVGAWIYLAGKPPVKPMYAKQ